MAHCEPFIVSDPSRSTGYLIVCALHGPVYGGDVRGEVEQALVAAKQHGCAALSDYRRDVAARTEERAR